MVGVPALLGILFTALKLTHVINWSWWLVTLPFYGGAVLAVALSGIMAIFVAIGVSKTK